ncbi:NTP transferase domain-containing protein [Odoribacter sp. OttesenSCG-928-L07]|nr:NTP transferase domain-containing protein [Odoribacter sp. OttesenSCG-928-L07]
MVVNLFIPSAGLGTRLLPLTADKPKALVEINGKPMIQYLLDKFLDNDFLKIDKIIVNVHHFADLMIDFFGNYDKHKIIISDEREQLLDTGGGLKQALQILKDDKPLLVHNVDIETDFNFPEFLNKKPNDNVLSTLIVSKRETSRYLLFDDEMKLCGWKNIKTGESIIVDEKDDLQSFAYSGIQLVNPKLLPLMSSEKVFPLIPEYLRLANDINFAGFNSNSYFNDLGKL